MNVSLTPELEGFVKALTDSGRYRSASGAGRAAVRLLPLLLAAFGCTSDSSSDEIMSRTDSAGVAVVHYAALDTSRTWSVSAEPTLSIGQVEGEEPYLLTWASGIQRMDDGSILVVENQDAEIRIFDDGGTHLRTMGGPGDGPGEFGYIDWAGEIRGDSILAWDGQLRRVTVFTADGELGRLATADMPDGVSLLLVEGGFEDGTLLVHPVGRRPELVPGTVVRDTLTWARWNPLEPDTLTPVARWPTDASYLDQEGRFWPIPFNTTPVAGIGSATVLTSPGGSFLVDRYSSDGRHLLRLRVDQEPRPIREDEVQAYKDARLSSAESQNERAALERRFQELPFPDHHPTVDQLLIDALGALWVGVYDPDSANPKSWHVFDETGEYMAYVDTPDGLEIHDIQEDAILGRWRDPLGVRSIRVYRLDRSPPE